MPPLRMYSSTTMVEVLLLSISLLIGTLCAATPTAHAAPYIPPVVDPGNVPSGSLIAPVAQMSPCSHAVDTDNLQQREHTQRFHPLVDARPIWHLTRGEGQTVAIIDTGINPHPRLPNVTGLADFDNHNGLSDCDQHGTLVAAILGASPHQDGFAGVAPDVRIYSIRQTSSHFAVVPPPPVDLPPHSATVTTHAPKAAPETW